MNDSDQPTDGSLSAYNDGDALKNGRSHPAELFTDEFLGKACANFKQLIEDEEALVKNAQNFVRAMYLPVADVQAVLAKTTGNYVKVYYGVMDDMHGKHFIFMAPGDAPVDESESPRTASLRAVNFIGDAQQPVTLSVAVPECIGRIPPCPEINDQFVQL